MTYQPQLIKNIKWHCLECGAIITDQDFGQLPVDGKGVRVCPGCSTSSGYFISAERVQQRLTS